MRTREKIRKYKQLLTEDSAAAAKFFDEHKDDEVFVTLIKLGEEFTPAFLEAGKVIREDNK